jgi:hypothetical protein
LPTLKITRSSSSAWRFRGPGVLEVTRLAVPLPLDGIGGGLAGAREVPWLNRSGRTVATGPAVCPAFQRTMPASP